MPNSNLGFILFNLY